jgi:hypothetical protein
MMPSEAPWLPDLDGTPIFATKHYLEVSEKGGFSLLRIFFSTTLRTRFAEKSQIFRALRFAKRCYRKKYIRRSKPPFPLFQRSQLIHLTNGSGSNIMK